MPSFATTNTNLRYLPALLLLLPRGAPAAGPFGADAGFVLDSNGNSLLTDELLTGLVNAGTGWLRLDFHPVGSPSLPLWGETMLGYYAVAVAQIRSRGIRIMGLFGPGFIRGSSQSVWNANSFEETGRDGSTEFVTHWAANASLVAARFAADVTLWELFNEPSAWTSSNNGSYSGGTFMYPSVFARLLSATYAKIKGPPPVGAGLQNLTLFSGSVFGTSAYGWDAFHSGATYISSFYGFGTACAYHDPFANRSYNCSGAFPAPWGSNASMWPLDGVGQHIYVDQGAVTTADRVAGYIEFVAAAMRDFEGLASKKRIFISEMGWTTSDVNESVQARNVETSLSAIRSNATIMADVGVVLYFQFVDNPAANLFYGVMVNSTRPKLALQPYAAQHAFEGVWANASVSASFVAAWSAAGGLRALGSPFDAGDGGGPWVHCLTDSSRNSSSNSSARSAGAAAEASTSSSGVAASCDRYAQYFDGGARGCSVLIGNATGGVKIQSCG